MTDIKNVPRPVYWENILSIAGNAPIHSRGVPDVQGIVFDWHAGDNALMLDNISAARSRGPLDWASKIVVAMAPGRHWLIAGSDAVVGKIAMPPVLVPAASSSSRGCRPKQGRRVHRRLPGATMR